ncbi:MAG: 2-C-methyl-D-erythritol 4-phosphate cytidylyltransferase [Candidatus Aminicenantes bacterium]|nr:2-C-methyl-D-erythritol 4-phosphate cytidylyltransferase [Candidatus Aminicenantes bacterium]
MNIFVSAIIVAAGNGIRFGGGKQTALLKGRSILDRALDPFQRMSLISDMILVLPQGQDGEFLRRRFPKMTHCVPGGQERQDSVQAGFAAVDGNKTDVVLVHDGARPLVREDLITRVIRAAEARGAAVPVVPVEDTVKSCRNGKVIQTLDRSSLFRTQTPQAFQYKVLEKALRRAALSVFIGTDEASFVEELGVPVFCVPGDPTNIKITTLLDMKIAEAFLDA